MARWYRFVVLADLAYAYIIYDRMDRVQVGQYNERKEADDACKKFNRGGA